MSGWMQSSPALAVALPLAGAFALLWLGKAWRWVKNAVFFGGVAAGAFAAISAAGRALREGSAEYVFGAGKAGAAWFGAGVEAIRIHFCVDGAGALMLLAAAVASVAAALYACRSEAEGTAEDHLRPLFLLLVAGVYGMFATGDAFNFFVFLEITSLAGAALTAARVDGGLAVEAGLKYAAISSLGGLSYLAGAGLLLAGHDVLNMRALSAAIAGGAGPLDYAALGLMAVPLAMKAGTVPMHQWTPDTYSRAPHPVSAFLLVSSQASLFGLFRVVFTVFGAGLTAGTHAGLILTVLATLSMFVGVTMAIPQHDVKRLISHHAVSQTGYMLLGAGVAAACLGRPEALAEYGRDALAGSLFHMVNYALYNGLLFLAAGAVIWRTGARNLDDMGGLGRKMPVTMACFGVGALAIAGIPPMSGFASKWVLYESVFRYSPVLSVVAMAVSLLTLASFVKVFQAMFLGPARAKYEGVKEVPAAMWGPMVALAAATVAIGLFPDTVMEKVLLPAADALLKGLQGM